MKMPTSRGAGWRHGAPGRQSGISIVLVALALFMLMGFTALSVDGGNLFVARNELHNAADAGSLAGARMLYTQDGSSVNPGANQIATDAAQANNSQNTPSEVISALRGHWSFATRTFTPNDSLEPVDLFEKSTAELDEYDPFNPFINAVEVVTAREQTQVEAFFGRIFGFNGYDVGARSVAYIGFAGSLRKDDVDMPIAMCKKAVTSNGNYSCNVGRMISSNDETGGWTNYSHELTGGANAREVRDLIEDGGSNPDTLYFGQEIETAKGQMNSAYSDFFEVWEKETEKQRLWSLTLPVVDCEGGVNPGTIQPSSPLVGAVTVHVVWVVDQGQANHIDSLAPTQMELPPEDSSGVSPGVWSEDPSLNGEERWDSFVREFNIHKSESELALWNSSPQENGWRQKTIYFLPSCSYHEPKGQTGGENFGILARIPVLVD